jgi:adenosylhomocysteine nucleosidase
MYTIAHKIEGVFLKRLGLITGMVDEAACLEGIPADVRPDVRCSGARSANAFSHTQELIAEGCDGLVSFGMAGGLSADLAPGDIVISAQVIAEEDTWQADAAWADALSEKLEKVHRGNVWGSNAAVTSPDQKAHLATQSGAVIVDMESHAVARAAAQAGIKFIVVRVVADAHTRAIPTWVTGGIREDGSVNLPAMVVGALTHPWHVPALIGLASDSGEAKKSLRRVALLGGFSFGLGTLG